MAQNSIKILSVVMVAIIIVCVDYLLFRHAFWQRLFFNVGIFLVYLALYLKFLNK